VLFFRLQTVFHMNIDPSTTKYMIKAKLQADGIVEKPDVVGAIFGQTEGLLGDELDLRDLQKSGRIGRIEVEVGSKAGKSEGEVLIPSSLDQVETVILASALETIDRVGPCKAKINIVSIEDVRITKRARIIDRAKELLGELMRQSKNTGIDLTESVRQSVQMEEIITWGKDRLPAGPNVLESDAIIIVEGRSDVLNLLRSGIKNAVAVEGTNVPKSIAEMSKERIITAFVDGDRGGELILRELFQVAEVDFVARAPRAHEVEELTQKQIMKCLRNKIPAEQFIEMYGLGEGNGRDDRRRDRDDREDRRGRRDREDRFRDREDRREREDRFKPEERVKAEERKVEERPKIEERPRAEERKVEERPKIEERPRFEDRREREDRFRDREDRRERKPREERPSKKLTPEMEKFKELINELTSTSTAKLLDAQAEVKKEVPVRELVSTLKSDPAGLATIVFDGIITQRILDICAEHGIATVVGTRMGNVTKQPADVEVWTKEDLN
jgi:DNA primase